MQGTKKRKRGYQPGPREKSTAIGISKEKILITTQTLQTREFIQNLEYHQKQLI